MLEPTTTRNLDSVTSALRAGRIAIVPTDTVYGVAASIEHPDAIERLFDIKGRPRDKPIPILVDSLESAVDLSANFTETARMLAAEFWPGALTIIVRARARVPTRCLGPGGTIGLRVPDHPVTIELLRQCGGALAVTSANRSGEPETTCADSARASLPVDTVLDTGKTSGGIASTVIDATLEPPKILRHGAILESQIIDALAR